MFFTWIKGRAWWKNVLASVVWTSLYLTISIFWPWDSYLLFIPFVLFFLFGKTAWDWMQSKFYGG